MKVPAIFFISSTLAKGMAQKLSDILDLKMGKKKLECRLWWKVIEPGKYTLQGLLEECQWADFAIIILTSDDYLADYKKEKLIPAPRDNCIFEAGLFMGALGADPQRCFLLADEKLKGHLLSDIDGLTFIPLNIPNNFYNEVKRVGDDCPDPIVIPKVLEESLNTAADIIVRMVKSRNLYMRLDQDNALPNVSKDTLVSFEKPKNEQGILKKEQIVLIMSSEPIESDDPSFAAQIIRNMKNGIYYEYIFHAHEDKIKRYAQLLFTLAAVKPDGSLAERPLEDNLNAMSRLRIRFVPYVPGIELCIHNATDKAAQCYLRFPWDSKGQRSPEDQTEENDKFAVWCYGDTARNIRRQLLDRPIVGEGDNHIFVSTMTFNLKAIETKVFCDALVSEIKKSFKDSFLELLPKFFGENTNT